MGLDLVFVYSLATVSIFFVWFLLSIFLAFYIPGRVVTGSLLKKSQGRFEKIILCLVTGMILWVFQGLAFGYLHARFLSYGYLLSLFIIWIKKYAAGKSIMDVLNLKVLRQKHFNIPYLLVTIFVVGIFGQMIQFFITGFTFSNGIHSVMAAADDLMWHTAVISELTRRFPPHQPGLSNTFLHNYHFLSDLVTAELIRVFHLPYLATQFQFSYLLVSFLLGGVAYTLARTLNFSVLSATIFVYLQYFSSDVIYLITFITTRVFEFKVHPLEEGTMLLENPPRAFSYVVTYAGIIFLFYWLKHKSTKAGLISGLCLGSVIGFKVHTGLGILGGLLFLVFYFLAKKEIRMLVIPVFAVLISMAIHIPVNKLTGMPIYAPFEMSRMFAVQKALYLSHLELARRIYLTHFNYLQVWRMDITMLILLLIGQLGLKNLGWFPVKEMLIKLGTPLSIFLYASLLSLLILGTFFYQPIGGADIFNFYLAAGRILALFAAFNIAWIIQKVPRLIKIAIIIAILTTTLPRWVYKVDSFVHLFNRGPLITSAELDAFSFIQKNTDKDVVMLVANKGQWDSRHPYVTAFTYRDTFLSGQNILYGHSVPYKKREETVETIFTSTDSNKVSKLLSENGITILYFYGNGELSSGLKGIPLKRVFQNSEITLYKFEKDYPDSKPVHF